jgi:hypothetical protein
LFANYEFSHSANPFSIVACAGKCAVAAAATETARRTLCCNVGLQCGSWITQNEMRKCIYCVQILNLKFILFLGYPIRLAIVVASMAVTQFGLIKCQSILALLSFAKHRPTFFQSACTLLLLNIAKLPANIDLPCSLLYFEFQMQLWQMVYICFALQAALWLGVFCTPKRNKR